MILKILFNGWEHLKDQLMSKWYKSQMRQCGNNVSLHPSTSVYFGLKNLSLRCFARIFSQTFNKQDYNWKEVFKPF